MSLIDERDRWKECSRAEQEKAVAEGFEWRKDPGLDHHLGLLLDSDD
jgi:hypothetical protein